MPDSAAGAVKQCRAARWTLQPGTIIYVLQVYSRDQSDSDAVVFLQNAELVCSHVWAVVVKAEGSVETDRYLKKFKKPWQNRLCRYFCGADVQALAADKNLTETARRSQQVRTQQSLLSMVLMGFVSIAYIFALWDRSNQLVLAVWVAVIVALTAWRAVISSRIRSGLAEADPHTLAQNEADLVPTGLLIPLVIGAGYWFLCITEDGVIILAVTLICCLYAVGSVVNTVAQRRMQIAMLVLNLGQGILFFAFNGVVEYYPAAVQLLALILLLLGFAGRIQSMFVELVESDLEIRRQNELILQSRFELESALEVAVVANREKSQVLAAASHDLSQPLHAMSLFVGNLKQTIAGDRKQQELVRKIENTSLVLQQQFDGLLDMSRFDAGGVTVNKKPFDLYGMCELLLQSEKSAAAARGIELTIAGDHVTVVTDPVLLGRLVGNLLANAIKFTSNGKVELLLKQSGEQVSFSVIDSGCGFTEEDKDRIFDDFTQLNNPDRSINHGAGLGLSIVRRISDLLGFELKVKSIPGVGSEFTLLIPIDKLESGSDRPDRSANMATYLEEPA